MLVQQETRDGIALLALDDVERRNILSRALVTELKSAFDVALDQRAVVITAQGRYFCGGANISDLLEAGWMEGRSEGPDPIDVFEAVESAPRLVIAAVNGPALGGGCELTLCCDLVIASQSATFAMPEVGHGVIPNTGLAKLIQMIGVRSATELVMTGRQVSAAEALKLGLVNMVVPNGMEVNCALELARSITANAPPGAIAAVKTGLRRQTMTQWQAVRDSLADTSPEEWREGLGAFLEKRKPDYSRFWRSGT